MDKSIVPPHRVMTGVKRKWNAPPPAQDGGFCVEAPADKIDVERRETILLADDNFDVRWFIKTVLEEYYFNVIEAVDGQDALNKFHENEGTIDLLIFDYTMPKMTGHEAYARIKEVRPDIKVLFTSGIHLHACDDNSIGKGSAFIPKPFSPVAFLKKVSEILRASAA